MARRFPPVPDSDRSLPERREPTDWTEFPKPVQKMVDNAERLIGWVLVLQLVAGIGLFVVIAIIYAAVQQTSGLIVMLVVIGGNILIFSLILMLLYRPIVRREFVRAVTPCLIFAILAIISLSIIAAGLLFVAYWNLRKAREWIAPPGPGALRAP